MTTEVSLHLMALVFVVFMATLYLLNIWLFKPLIHFMEKREESINQDVQEIKDSASEVEYINQEIQQILSHAHQEAKQMMENALAEAKSVSDAKLARQRGESQAKLQEFAKKLEEEKASLKADLLSQKALFQDALRKKISQI